MRSTVSCVSSVLVALVVSSCFEVPVLEPRDAPSRDAPRSEAEIPFVIEAIRARDGTGRAWPLDALPRRPRFELDASLPLLEDPEAFFVIAGEPDDALRDDAARRPLTLATRARVIDSELSRDADVLVLAPREPLAPGATITIVVSAFATSSEGQTLGMPWIMGGSVSVDPSAGASVIGAFPADGTIDVPLDALPLVLALDGDVSLGSEPVRARVAGRSFVPRVTVARCAPLGLDGASCLSVDWARALVPASSVELETTSDLRDATGASITPVVVHVTTSAGPDLEDPFLVAPSSCALDAAADRTRACVVSTDATWRAELVASEPVRVELTSARGVVRSIATRGRARLALDALAPDAVLDATLSLVDLAGRRASMPFPIETTPSLAPLTITEIAADPEGPEPAQEWIEIANLGAEPASLEGLSLADREADEGVPVRSSRVLVPGARVLLVPDAFDPDLAGVPAGTPLVTMGRTLVPSGLSNAGELVVLRDGEGHRLAFVPAIAAEEGRCLVRDAERGLRADAIEDFHYSACSPGR